MKFHQVLEFLENTSDGDGTVDWESLKRQYGFSITLPRKSDLLPQPVAPEIPPAPHEDDAAYIVELTKLDKLVPSRRRKKEDAALHRFERDRKRWNDNRLNALAHYEFARKNYAKNMEVRDQEYASAITNWKTEFLAFLRENHASAA